MKTNAKMYRTIVIDPPWDGPGAVPAFQKRKDGTSQITLIPYQTMGGVELATLRIPEIAAPDAQLWIWTTSRHKGDAYLLAQAWGFTYRALFIWQKPPGMGRHCRHDAEFLLWCARKGAPLIEPRRVPQQTHHWPRPRRHSEKPAEAYWFIAGLSPEPRIDIFARQHRPGFDAWGNEVPKQRCA